MRFLFTFLYLGWSIFALQAQNTVSETTEKDADAIITFDDLDIELVNRSKMIIRRKASITVLNKKGDHFSSLILFYDTQNRIKDVRAEIYDKEGNLIKKIQKSDFEDLSATDHQTLYSDDRVLYYKYLPNDYPYTIRYEYEMINKNTAFIPAWHPVASSGTAVKKSTYSFRYPDSSFEVQKLEKNLDTFNVYRSSEPGWIRYMISDISPIRRETLGPPLEEVTPWVKIAIDKFYLAGKEGEAGSWKKLGAWMYDKLLKPRNNLPESTVSAIRKMVQNISDPMERAKVVYEYMQKKTRYINVAIGIGGWQPMRTADVDRLGYGDCKALTYYTLSLMEAAGVEAYYTVVYAGSSYKKNIEKDLVAIQGNHAILCLPNENDTIWLECTNHKLPFGHKNSFTDDRDVWVVMPGDGKIRHTDTYSPEENLLEIEGEFELAENGDLKGKAKWQSYGTQYENFLSYFDALSPDELKKHAKEYLGYLHNLNISEIEATNNKNEKKFELDIALSAEHYATENPDGSMIMNLNVLNRNNFVPKREPDRKTSFEILRGYKDSDTYIIRLPSAYRPESLPQPVRIENQFGKYIVEIEELPGNRIKYSRIIILNKGKYPKDLYEKYRKFRKKIRKLENIKILLIK